MTDPVVDDLHAWADTIAGPGTTAFANAATAAALADIVTARAPHLALQNQIAAKTKTRDQIKAAAQDAEATQAGYVGQTFSFPVTTTSGQATVTGSFAAMQTVAGGWIQGAGLQAGTLVSDWATGTLTLSKPATASGTVTVTVQTGSLAVQDATIADLTAQKAALTAELATITTGTAILATITNGRAALVAAGHYLAPRTILRDGVSDQTSAIQTWLGTVPDGSGAFTPNYAHLWRGSTYRVDGTITLSARNNLRWDHHSSVLTPGVTGNGTRVHISVEGCTQTRIVRPKIRGSLPDGAPTFSSTYAGQHGVQVLDGANIVIDRPDIDGVYGSGVRIGRTTTDPNVVKIIGTGTVGRCGNHVLGVAACDGLEWTTVAMGASGRDTIAVSPASGIVCDGVNLHDLHLAGAISDAASFSLSARSAGKINNLTVDGVTADAAHGPLRADIAATTSGTPHTNVTITDNAGSGSLLNTARAAWLVTNATNLIFTGNTQAMAQSGGSDVMYGLKGTTIGGTVTVSGNTLANSVDQALIDKVAKPGKAATITINFPTSLGPFAPGVSLGSGIQFTAQHSAGGETWTHSTPSGGTALPSGVTFSSGGLLAGTPGGGTAGSYTHRFTVTDSLSQTTYVDLTFKVASNLAITTTSLSAFTVGTDASASLAAQGGTGSYHWSLNSGSLPTGFTLDDDGTLHVDGSAIAKGSTDITFKVTDELTPTADTDTQKITLSVSTSSSSFDPTVYDADRTWIGFSGPQAPQRAGQLTAAGIALKVVRVQVDGQLVNGTKNAWTWGSIDSQVTGLLSAGVQVCLLLTYPPKWLTGGGHDVPGTTTMTAFLDWWGDFCARAVDRYCKGGTSLAPGITATNYVQYYELWNEPNLNTFMNPVSMVNYADMMAVGYDAMKDVTGWCHVGGGPSSVVNYNFTAATIDILARLKAQGYKAHVRGWADIPADMYFLHPYCGGRLGAVGASSPALDCTNNATYNAYANRVPECHNVLYDAGFGVLKVWGTEFGGGHALRATTGYGLHGPIASQKGPAGGAGDSNVNATGVVNNGGAPERKIMSGPEYYSHVKKGFDRWMSTVAWPTGSNLTAWKAGSPQLGPLFLFAGSDFPRGAGTQDAEGYFNNPYMWESRYGLFDLDGNKKRGSGAADDGWDALISVS